MTHPRSAVGAPSRGEPDVEQSLRTVPRLRAPAASCCWRHSSDRQTGSAAAARSLPSGEAQAFAWHGTAEVTSIRARLLASILATLAFGALVMGLAAYRNVLHEAEALFDYQLRQMALSLRDQGEIAVAQAVARWPTPSSTS